MMLLFYKPRGFGTGRFGSLNLFRLQEGSENRICLSQSTRRFVENGNLSYFVKFGEPTPFLPKIVPLANGFKYVDIGKKWTGFD
jgi:hypothetical protein